MRRRNFAGCLAAAPIAWSFAAAAQQPKRLYRIGILVPSDRESAPLRAFFDELRRAGFVEGDNLSVSFGRFSVGGDELRESIAALLAAAPDAIVSGGDVPMRALQEATRTVPLLCMTEDMVQAGLVRSLARPGGNTTGISLMSSELDPKRQEILIEALPKARRFAILVDAESIFEDHLQALRQATERHNRQAIVASVSNADTVLAAIDDARARGAEALNVLSSARFQTYVGSIIAHVAAHRLPTIYQWPDLAREGGLMGYGPSYAGVYRQRARMLVKVLRGVSVGAIPVEQPDKFEFVVNLRAARAMGIEIAPSLLNRADEVIE